MIPMHPPFDPERQQINGRPLGPMGWALFRTLWNGQGHPVPKDRLAALFDSTCDANLRVHVFKLNARLRGTGYVIKSVPWIGYELCKT